MCSASSFKFTSDKSLAKKGGYCYVVSADLSLVEVYPPADNDSVLWMDVARADDGRKLRLRSPWVVILNLAILRL